MMRRKYKKENNNNDDDDDYDDGDDEMDQTHLPIYKHREKLMEHVLENKVILV